MKFTEELNRVKDEIALDLKQTIEERLAAYVMAEQLMAKERVLVLAMARASKPNNLKSNCCARCYVHAGVSLPVVPVNNGTDIVDKFICQACGWTYEVEFS